MKEMPEQVNPEDIVLYHGSLKELNGVGRGEYVVPSQGNPEYVSRQTTSNPEDDLGTLSVRKEILEKGFHGLVNRRIVYVGENESFEPIFRIEGTPVKRVLFDLVKDPQ